MSTPVQAGLQREAHTVPVTGPGEPQTTGHLPHVPDQASARFSGGALFSLSSVFRTPVDPLTHPLSSVKMTSVFSWPVSFPLKFRSPKTLANSGLLCLLQTEPIRSLKNMWRSLCLNSIRHRSSCKLASLRGYCPKATLKFLGLGNIEGPEGRPIRSSEGCRLLAMTFVAPL